MGEETSISSSSHNAALLLPSSCLKGWLVGSWYLVRASCQDLDTGHTHPAAYPSTHVHGP